MTLALFVLAASGGIIVWNRFYRRIPAAVAIGFIALTIAYQSQTLFTSRVDIPGNLAYSAYPWRALGGERVSANTGIVFTQLAPWTNAARSALRRGEIPQWNRFSACGAPLLANQQTALLHPFTLLGLLLPIGKAFTLSVCLRLLSVLLFTFLFLRRWDLGTAASVFGAVSYAFCTFHIVWLLFPLGLSTMMLPLILVGIDELLAQRRVIGALPLVAGVAGTLLGGHPESAAWVLVTAAAYAMVCVRAPRDIARLAAAFAAGIAISAVFWFPTVRLLPHTTRAQIIAALRQHPPVHRFSADWFLPLIAPNVLGTVPSATYRAPQPSNVFVLDDYGEVASGYAGMLPLGFALLALFHIRARPRLFFAAAIAFALLTMMEAPYWHGLIVRTPLLGLTLLGRLRFVFAFGIAMLGACGFDDWLRNRVSTARAVTCILAAWLIVAAPYVARRASMTHVIVATIAVVAAIVVIRKHTAAVVVAAAFFELVAVTFRYNPPARPSDVYPVTGAIAHLQRAGAGARFAAIGWSFLAETASFYALEDIKTTDPIGNPEYLRVATSLVKMKDYDQIILDPAAPFFDFLGVKHFYVPPDQTIAVTPSMREVYRGNDGRVIENLRVLPRYFSPNDIAVEPDLTRAIDRLNAISDYRHSAVVDRIPAEVQGLAGSQIFASGAEVALRSYTSNASELFVKGAGWNLVVSSDTAWPGWTATWNGRALPVVKVNGAFVGVFVPPGEGTLLLRYRAPGLIAGAIVSALAIVLLIGSLCRAAAPGGRPPKAAPLRTT